MHIADTVASWCAGGHRRLCALVRSPAGPPWPRWSSTAHRPPGGTCPTRPPHLREHGAKARRARRRPAPPRP